MLSFFKPKHPGPSDRWMLPSRLQRVAPANQSFRRSPITGREPDARPDLGGGSHCEARIVKVMKDYDGSFYVWVLTMKSGALGIGERISYFHKKQWHTVLLIVETESIRTDLT